VEKMKKIFGLILMLFMVPVVMAGYYYDDYTDGIFNWTDTNSAGWYENATNGYIASTNIAVHGQIIKDFGSLYNLSDNLNINTSIYGQIGDYSFFTDLFVTDADSYASQTNYVRFGLNYEYYGGGYDDIFIICGGSCNCTFNVTDGSFAESGYYVIQIYYSADTGKIELYRNDSAYVSTYLNGCDISNWNVTIYQQREPICQIYNFELSAGDYPVCTPDWYCSQYTGCLPNGTMLCDVVTDNNSCGSPFSGSLNDFPAQSCTYPSNVVFDENYGRGGIYSNLYNIDLQEFIDGFMWDVDGGSPDKGYLDLNDITETNNPLIEWNLSKDWNMTIISKANDTTPASNTQLIFELGGSLPYTDALDINLIDYNVDGNIYLRSYCYPNGSFCTSGLTYTDVFYSETANTDEHTYLVVYSEDTQEVDIYNDGVLNLTMPLTFNTDGSMLMVAVNGYAGIKQFYVQQVSGCVPLWSCDGYGACLPNSTQECNSAIDLNACGELYGGDYSEFPAQPCNYTMPTGYVAQYEASDFDDIVGDGLGTGGSVFVVLLPIVVIGGIFVVGYKYMKKVRR
jgi:hypothetical protein